MMQNVNGDPHRIWAFADPLINGLTTVILMERNLAPTPGQDTVPSVSMRALTAARRIIHALFLISNQKQSTSVSTLK